MCEGVKDHLSIKTNIHFCVVDPNCTSANVSGDVFFKDTKKLGGKHKN